MKPKILAFAGSTRSGSYNKMLAKLAAEAARKSGADVTLLDLRDLALPLYDGDLESQYGLPEGALRLKQLMKEADGFIVAAPEYNSSITGVMKNAIDWASRPAPNEKPLEPFADKVALLLAASPGAFGGIRGLPTVRLILANLGTLVLSQQLAVPRASEAFTETGRLKDPKQQAALEKYVGTLVAAIIKLKQTAEMPQSA
jgi:chromate reductase